MKSELQLKSHLKRVKSCGNRDEILYNFNKNFNPKLKVITHRCKSYFCEKCSTHKKLTLETRLKKSLKFKDIRFLTLTLKPKFDNTYHEITYIKKTFNNLIYNLKKNNIKFNYFYILEFTKKNQPHLHIFIDKYVNINIIREHWAKWTKSPQMEIKKVTNRNKTIKYLIKYLSKTINNKNNKTYYLNSKRRYSYSRNFLKKITKIEEWKRTGVYYDGNINFIKDIINYFIINFGLLYNENDLIFNTS